MLMYSHYVKDLINCSEMYLTIPAVDCTVVLYFVTKSNIMKTKHSN